MELVRWNLFLAGRWRMSPCIILVGENEDTFCIAGGAAFFEDGRFGRRGGGAAEVAGG